MGESKKRVRYPKRTERGLLIYGEVRDDRGDVIDTGAETRDGRALYLHPDWPDVRFVIARASTGQRPVLVTVLDAATVREKRQSGARWRRRRA